MGSLIVKREKEKRLANKKKKEEEKRREEKREEANWAEETKGEYIQVEIDKRYEPILDLVNDEINDSNKYKSTAHFIIEAMFEKLERETIKKSKLDFYKTLINEFLEKG